MNQEHWRQLHSDLVSERKSVLKVRVQLNSERVQFRTGASIHPPHHHAGYAPVRLFCMKEHDQQSSWLHSHRSLWAYPEVNGCSVGGRYPSTRPPTGQYHSTGSGKL